MSSGSVSFAVFAKSRTASMLPFKAAAPFDAALEHKILVAVVKQHKVRPCLAEIQRIQTHARC